MNIRRVAEWAVPVAGTLAVPAISLAFAGDLPDPIAVHWGVDGEPDGAGSLVGWTAVSTAVVAVLGVGPIAALDRVPSRTTRRILVATAHATSVFLVALHVFGLASNAGAPSWEQADRLGAGSMLVLLVVALPFAAIGWVLPADRPEPADTTQPATPVAVAPGEAVVWSGRASVRGAWIPVAIAVAVLGVLAAVGDPAVTGIVTGVAVVLAVLGALTLSGARVTVGPAGVRVAVGPLPWPAIRVPLADVADVAVVDVRPMAYGGWGYRVVPGARAVVMRAGEGLRIGRRGSAPDLVVTVDDARTGAGVLLAHVAGEGHAPSA